MKQRTHAVIGLWAGVALGFAVNAEPLGFGVLICSGVIGAVAPDIDSRGSVIRHASYHVYRTMEVMPLRHRGMTHSGLAALLLSVIAWKLHPLYGVPCIIGYGSHLLLDMMTRSGVALFRPFWSRPLYLLPKRWRVRAVGAADGWVFLILMACFLADTYRWLWARGGLP